MALLNRFARLLRADAHAVLDRLEEPTALLREALREMEDAVSGETRQLGAAQARQTQLAQRRAEVAATLARIGEELDLAFGAANEKLARGLLRRRLEHERLAALFDQRLTALDAELAARAARLEDHRQRLDALRQQASLVEAAVPGEAPPDPPAAGVSDADVELAWLRERQQRGAP
jgi:phage shock protein A